MIWVTVIIPVYNNARTLLRCIQSVQEQTLKDIEIVCVDDGSTDDSLVRLKTFSKEDSRIRVFHKENGGAGSARNVGIQYIQGKYVIFLDADDFYIQNTALEQMVLRCENEKLKACGSFMSLMQDGVVKHSGSYKEMLPLVKERHLLYSDYQWDYDFTTFLLATDLIKEFNLTFPETRFFEDPPFLVQALYHAEYFAVEAVDLYCYTMERGVRKLSEYQCVALLEGILLNLKFSCENGLCKLFMHTLDRLEYEYGDWICYRQENSSKLMKFIKKIQEYIQTLSGYETYELCLLQKNRKNEIIYERYLKERIEKEEDLYIYGNGKTARVFRDYLRENNWLDKYKGTVVTQKSDAQNEEELYDIETFAKIRKGLVIIAVSGIYVGEIVRTLQQYDISNYEILNSVFLSKLV